MKFIAKAFALAFISGVAFATRSGHNLQTLSPMERLKRQTGTLINKSNMNCNIQAGSGCYGSIVGNLNGRVHCEDSTVEMRGNSNMKAWAASSTLEIRSNTNLQVEAEDVRCKFVDNINLEFKGKGGSNQFSSQFVGNLNCKVGGTNNRVVANSNSNLSVGGNGNQLEISKTQNHDVRPAGSSRSTVTVRKHAGNRNFNFDIEYAESAHIDGSTYQLGNYNFDVTASDDKMRVTVQNGSVKTNTSSKIVIEGQGSQTLEFNGVRVEMVDANSFDIFV